MRKYFLLGVLIALFPVLAIAACGSQATTPFGAVSEDSGALPPGVTPDGGIASDAYVPPLGISDDASKPLAVDAGQLRMHVRCPPGTRIETFTIAVTRCGDYVCEYVRVSMHNILHNIVAQYYYSSGIAPIYCSTCQSSSIV